MPAEGLQWLGRQEILSFEEISRLVGILARLGVDEVRLTGGESVTQRLRTMAAVGHASTQRMQVPHRSGGGASGTISSETSTSPRKNHDPIP
jgi:cyclic pyranopterin phosphate synthase